MIWLGLNLCIHIKASIKKHTVFLTVLNIIDMQCMFTSTAKATASFTSNYGFSGNWKRFTLYQGNAF